MNRPTPAQDRIRAALPEINAMIEAKMSQKEIAKRIGVSETSLKIAIKSGIAPDIPHDRSMVTPAQNKIRAALPEIKAMLAKGVKRKDIVSHIGVSSQAWQAAIRNGIVPKKEYQHDNSRLRRFRIKKGWLPTENISDEALASLAAYAHRNDIDNLAEAVMEIALDALAEGRLK